MHCFYLESRKSLFWMILFRIQSMIYLEVETSSDKKIIWWTWTFMRFQFHEISTMKISEKPTKINKNSKKNQYENYPEFDMSGISQFFYNCWKFKMPIRIGLILRMLTNRLHPKIYRQQGSTDLYRSISGQPVRYVIG